MELPDIIYTKQEGVATMTLNRPEAMNAFGAKMRDSIAKVVKDASEDNEVRVLVITGTGRAFCTGADVKDMAEEVNTGRRGEEATRRFQFPLPLTLWKFSKPTIAAVNGVAVGGGLDLALACDVRIASDKARFAQVFIRRGLIPVTGGTYFLPRLVGLDRALLLTWTGDMVDAKEAERIGMVTLVVPHDELETATRELAEKLAKGPPLAIQRAKRAIYEGLATDLDSAVNLAYSLSLDLWESEDHKEGTRAFVEKREPKFRGK
ncbi:MAG: enoyl-CoA hydratase/isomerase family protein [Chloroflexota bacterium]